MPEVTECGICESDGSTEPGVGNDTSELPSAETKVYGIPKWALEEETHATTIATPAQSFSAAAGSTRQATTSAGLDIATQPLQSVCVCKSDTPVFASLDAKASSSRTMPSGEIFSIGPVAKGARRIQITRLDGKREYLPAGAKIFRIRGAVLKSKDTVMYSCPSKASNPIDTLRVGAQIVLVDTLTNSEGEKLLEIRDELGQTGYINASVKVEPFVARSNSAGQEMLIGGVVCALGVVVTICTYAFAASSPHGGRFIIAYGPAIYGGIQFFRGYSRLGEEMPTVSLRNRLIAQIIQEKITRSPLDS